MFLDVGQLVLGEVSDRVRRSEIEVLERLEVLEIEGSFVVRGIGWRMLLIVRNCTSHYNRNRPIHFFNIMGHFLNL